MDWQQRDLQTVWHPCTQMKDHEEHPPIVIERGEGVYLYDDSGKRYLDAVSSWWVNMFGHANPRIAGAIATQALKLEQVIFSHFTHKPAIELAESIVRLAPQGLTRVFFADNGSAAIEVALKLSFQYHAQTGQPQRQKFIALTDAYHGETLGALAMGDLDLYAAVFKPLLVNTVRVQGPDCYRCPYARTRDNCGAECFEHMQRTLDEQGMETAAVIIEPLLQAAAGMKMYPPLYLTKLRQATREKGVHLIADEIASGFGRTGTLFGCEQAGITPDLMCVSKGLTGGFLPLALTLATEEIYSAFYDDYTSLRAFMHSHSYTGNPLACAAALASLAIFHEDDVITGNRKKAEYMRQAAGAYLAGHPMVGEYRQTGMVGALELVKDKATKEGFDWKERVGYRIYRIALTKGLLLRPLGNVLYFMPPYVITESEIDWMVKTAFEAIDDYFS